MSRWGLRHNGVYVRDQLLTEPIPKGDGNSRKMSDEYIAAAEDPQDPNHTAVIDTMWNWSPGVGLINEVVAPAPDPDHRVEASYPINGQEFDQTWTQVPLSQGELDEEQRNIDYQAGLAAGDANLVSMQQIIDSGSTSALEKSLAQTCKDLIHATGSY